MSHTRYIILLCVRFFKTTSNKDSYFRRVTNNLQEESPINFKTVLTIENLQTDTITDENAVIESFNLMNPSDVLDVIVEATYNMYVCIKRYDILYFEYFLTFRRKIICTRYKILSAHLLFF